MVIVALLLLLPLSEHWDPDCRGTIEYCTLLIIIIFSTDNFIQVVGIEELRATTFLQSRICYLFYWNSGEKPPVTNSLQPRCTRVRAAVRRCPVSQMYSVYLHRPVPGLVLPAVQSERSQGGWR